MDASSLNMLFEQVITLIAIVFIFIGFGGLILAITGEVYSDRLLNYAYAFVYSYMLVLGMLLFVYRKKILK